MKALTHLINRLLRLKPPLRGSVERTQFANHLRTGVPRR